jgi:hypothetical protein
MERKFIITLLIWILALSGCGTIRVADPGEIALSANEAVVFGKIIFIENNEIKIPYGLWGRKPMIRFFRIESEEFLRWGFEPAYEKDGSFYWIVPRGTYIVPDIKFDYTILPQVAFQIPYGADAFYIGTLKIEVETKHIIFHYYPEKVNIMLTDNFDKEKEILLKRNPDFTGKVEKALMIHDTSIPVDTSLYKQQKLLGILNAIGFGLLTIH